jgi:U6 snRNA phosphodiesterase
VVHGLQQPLRSWKITWIRLYIIQANTKISQRGIPPEPFLVLRCLQPFSVKLNFVRFLDLEALLRGNIQNWSALFLVQYLKSSRQISVSNISINPINSEETWMEAIAQYGSSDEEQHADQLHPSSTNSPLNPSTSNHSLHTHNQGRVRSFPHVPGNFAVHVFIDVPTPELCRRPLENLLLQIKQIFPDFSPVKSLNCDDGKTPLALFLAQPSYHVSLSRTLPIRLPHAEPLLISLRNNLHHIKRFTLCIHPILEVFLNDDKTRTFLALKASANPVVSVQQLLLTEKQEAAVAVVGAALKNNNDPLLQAIDAVSDAFEIEELQRFYDTPIPHISLGWLSGDQSAALSAAVLGGGSDGGGLATEKGEDNCSKIAAALRDLGKMQWQIEPDVIWCKIGHVKHSIWKSSLR